MTLSMTPARVNPGRFAAGVLATVGLLALLAMVAGRLPATTFFMLPTIVYAVAVAICLPYFRRDISPTAVAVIAFAVPVLFILGGQLLILFQGTPTRWLAWGRLPLGDSADFLSNAVVLLAEGEFVSIRGRPLSNAFIAGLWHSTGYDIALLGLAVSALCAASAFFFARVSLTVFGVAGGTLGLAVVLDFLHEHLGAASTEPIGFFTGLAAATLLITAAAMRSVPVFAVAMFCLATAFLYRVGAVFVIPALLAWPLLLQDGWRVGFRNSVLCCVAVAAAGVLHMGVAQVLTPNSPSFVNAPKSWYAIIAMGDEALGLRPPGSVREEARWVQIFDDHPGLFDLPPHVQGPRFVEIVLDAARERPLSVVAGSVVEYMDQLGRAGLFRFVDNKPVRLLVFLLFAVGLCRAVWRMRTDPLASLLALAGAGQLLSIPFLHGGENRVHIASAGLMAATCAFALQGLLARIAAFRLSRPEGRAVPRSTFAVLAVPLGTLAVSLTVTVTVPFQPAPSIGETSCADGASARLTALAPGSSLAVGPHSEDLFALSFENPDAAAAARAGWLRAAESSGPFLYVPLSDLSVPLRGIDGADTATVAYLAVLDQQPRPGARQVVLRGEDGAPGVRLRCLP